MVIQTIDGSGSKIFDLGWVRSTIFDLGLGLENFPQKSKIFQFFSLWLKKIASGRVKKYPGKDGLASYFLRVKSICSGWVRSGPISNLNT